MSTAHGSGMTREVDAGTKTQKQSGESAPFPAQEEQRFPTGWTRGWGMEGPCVLYFPGFIRTCPGIVGNGVTRPGKF